MWKYCTRAGKILTPVLQSRIEVKQELKVKGAKKHKEPREYEDGVQWQLDAHNVHEKTLKSDQLAQDVVVIMTAFIHTTFGARLAILANIIGLSRLTI